ncbi:MAG: GTP pyrophosphokinase family protein [Clostridia bacterium]|nr:GTP pyrophosphokinase family protein [Clostridia bacterium]MBQ2273577.1 GTP pyrophosphokinase family protein [Clostridia bacterium]
MELDNTSILHRLLEDEEIRHQLDGYLQMQHVYSAAIQEVKTKLQILDEEFQSRYDHNPIHHMESRLKSPRSVVEKLRRRNEEVSSDSARRNLTDIAGIRVVCCYIEDVYRIAELLLHQDDVTLIRKSDYIKNPKENGYRSLHLVIQIPVYLASRTERVPVEVQLRTEGMDFWASLEHQMRYKSSRPVSADLQKQLRECAEQLAEIDVKMQKIYKHLQ